MRRLLPCLLASALAAGAQAQLRTSPSPFGELPLPVEQAFALSSIVESERLLLRWEIEDGYYLYRQSLAFTAQAGGERLGEAELPGGETLTDEFFGEVEVYRDALQVSFPLQAGAPAELELTIQYQGCAEKRYCYPPQETALRLTLP